jgi:16S rRNA processing protein RimM
VGAFGLKGQLKVKPLTEFVERFQAGARLRLQGEWIEVEAMSLHKGRPLVKLHGVDSVEAAEALQWEYLEAVGRPNLDEDEFLSEDLIGLEVFTEDGEKLGVIDDVLANPAHDVFVIGEIMIPFVNQFVLSIDADARRVTVRLIPGMRGEDG